MIGGITQAQAELERVSVPLRGNVNNDMTNYILNNNTLAAFPSPYGEM